MKKTLFVLMLCLVMTLTACGQAGKEPSGTTAQTTAETTVPQTTTSETTAASAPSPAVLDTVVVRGWASAKAAKCYRKYVETVFNGRPNSIEEADYDPQAGVPSLIIKCDENYPQGNYTIFCDGTNAEIKGKSPSELSYAVCRFAQEFIDSEGNFLACDIANTMVQQRDPSILPYNGKYYVVGTGYNMRVSDDLYAWSDPWQFFVPDQCTNPDFDGIGDYWAPELYEYHGNFYIFGTYRSASSNHRGVGIFRSDLPQGPYELISKGHVTPNDWDSIDGSLYVDENGDPWMVFVHEWTSTQDGIGTMVASRMTDDLTALTGEITHLFSANELGGGSNNNVTDGPYVYRFENGRLAMIWSGFSESRYCVGVCYSDNGILGPWVQSEELLFSATSDNPLCYQEGGHGMLFESFDGKLLMSFHSPNSGFEAITYREVIAVDGLLKLK